jgi:hypothetical protein
MTVAPGAPDKAASLSSRRGSETASSKARAVLCGSPPHSVGIPPVTMVVEMTGWLI